jgi:taurine dioxygenase
MIIDRLDDSLGAVVWDVDLSKPLGFCDRSTLYDAWLEHLVLVFRNQDLTEAQQVEFSSIFGTPRVQDKPRHDDLPDKRPEVMLVGNVEDGALGNGPVAFHSDSSFMPTPLKATSLYALEVPDEGGDTLFVNMYDVYERPEIYEDRERLKKNGRTALFSYTRAFDGVELSARHPIVQRHEETGRELIYLNRLHSKEIESFGVSHQTDICVDCYLRDILEWIEEAPRYQHRWRPGDLVVWDNRCTQHARTDFSPTKRRLLRRVGIQP